MGRRLVHGLALALGITSGACFDEDLTLGDDCAEKADCGPGQQCVQTPEQQSHELFGWCRADGSCSVGQQPGCECDAVSCSSVDGIPLEAVHPDCASMSGTERETCMGMTAAQVGSCVCLIQEQSAM